MAVPTRAWLDAGRDPGKLLQGIPLEEAEAYARDHPADVLDEERAFLAEGLRRREAEREQARQAARRRRNAFIAIAGAMVVLIALTLWALYSRGEATRQRATAEAESIRAERQARLARSSQLAAQFRLASDPSGSLPLLLAREAVRTTWITDTQVITRPFVLAEADAALRQAVDEAPPWRMTLPRHRHTGTVHSAAYSPDGRRIVTASDDGTARMWDAETGAEVRVLEGHTSWVNSAAYSPDGQRIVTASWDRTARVWDAETGKELRVLEGHTDRVNSAAYSPDGTRIVTASRDRTARVWFSIDELLALADSLIQREPPIFTDEERVRYGLD